MRPVVVQRRPGLGHHRRAVGLPGVLLLAHPLHPHRAAGQGGGQQGGIGRGVVGAVVAVAAGALDMDAAHLLGRPAQHLGDRLAVGIDALGVGPHRQQPVLVLLRHGAGRADRPVQQIGPGIAGLQASGRRQPAASCRSRIGEILGRQRQQRLRQPVLVRQGRILLPLRRGGQQPHRLDRLELLLRHHRQEVAVAHHLDHPGQGLDRAHVQRRQPGAVAGRPHDPAVQHAGQAQILHIGLAAGHLGRDVDPRQRLAHHPEGGGVGQLRLRLRLDMQRQPGGQRAVGPPVAVRRQHIAGSRAAAGSAGAPICRAASASRISRTWAAALRIAVPLSCIEWLPAV